MKNFVLPTGHYPLVNSKTYLMRIIKKSLNSCTTNKGYICLQTNIWNDVICNLIKTHSKIFRLSVLGGLFLDGEKGENC